ncbi:MAG TPA: enoyl-CoA hydratase/isomerase family protein [Desulfomonilaceae bacterium]|nr:enoyl-CoA hydratase/isomerase family protein [Desulfomonilaceae bacterium]
MTYNTIKLTRENRVGLLLLNRPEVMNSINDQMRAELTEAFGVLATDPETLVVVISGVGTAFCGGADLRQFKDTYEEFRRTGRLTLFGGPELALLFSRFPKPMIAAVNGMAVGWGMTMPVACDIRLASANAMFSAPFVRVGLTPEFGSCNLLPRLIGYGRAAELFLTGRMIGAEEALRIGLIDRLVTQEDLIEQALGLARQIAAQPAGALIGTKSILRQGAAAVSSLDQWIEYEALVFQECMKSEEHYQAVTSLLAKMESRRQAKED